MKLKLLYTPRYSTSVNDDSHSSESGVPYLPPLGIATLTSFMKSRHFFVDQDDLMIKVHHHNHTTDSPDDNIDLSVFNDEKRINEFIRTGYDPLLEKIGERILGMTKCSGYDVFGFSLYGPFNPSVSGISLVLAKLLKERYDVDVIIGGVIDDRVSSKMLNSGLIDCRIIGEFTCLPESNLLNYCESYERGVPYREIPGIIYSDNGKTVVNRVNHGKETIFVRPDFDGLPMDIYRTDVRSDWGESQILVLPYFFIKGCPFKCAFCARSNDPYWAFNDMDTVADDIEELSRRYDTRYFFFMNPEINPSYDVADRFADTVIERGLDISWTDCANFRNMDNRLLGKLKRAGAVRMIFGFETGSQRMLDLINKDLDIDRAERILAKAHELGIWSQIEIICGFPYETEHDIDMTIEFINKNSEYIKDFDIFKFWLDGLFKKFPGRYNIKKFESGPRVSVSGNRIEFEELDGMGWKEKLEQMNYHFDKIKKIEDRLFCNSLFSERTRSFTNMDNEEKLLLNFMKWWDKSHNIEYFEHGTVSLSDV